MSIPAGELRERVNIQEKNLVDNGKGGRKRPEGEPEWINIAGLTQLRAQIIPLRGDEALSHSILRAVHLYRATLRARAGILASHRLMWGTIPLNIKAMAYSTDRREIIMTVEAGTPG